MCKNYFDIDIYLLILEKYYNGETVDVNDIEYLQDIKNVKHFFKEINRYSRDVLFKIPPYDIETNEYFYIIYYKEKCYRVSNDELNENYTLSEVNNLKEQLNKLNNQEDDVLQEIICIDNLLEHSKKSVGHVSHIVRKRK